MSNHTPRSQVRIVLVEDHVLFAESLELALTVEGYDVRRAGASDGSETPGTVLAAVLRQHPRIVLLDFDLGALGDGVRMVGPLAKAGVNVVIVTASTERARWGEALRYGARTVLSKSRPLNDILAAVRKINEGRPVLEVEERESLLRSWHQRRQELSELQQRIELLTRREADVLGLLMRGHTVHEIAALGVVSEATVRTQVKSILAKLEVSSQIAAVGMAHHLQWRPPGA